MDPVSESIHNEESTIHIGKEINDSEAIEEICNKIVNDVVSDCVQHESVPIESFLPEQAESTFPEVNNIEAVEDICHQIVDDVVSGCIQNQSGPIEDICNQIVDNVVSDCIQHKSVPIEDICHQFVNDVVSDCNQHENVPIEDICNQIVNNVASDYNQHEGAPIESFLPEQAETTFMEVDQNTADSIPNEANDDTFDDKCLPQVIQITIDEYVRKLKEKNVMFNIRDDRASVLHFLERDGNVYLTLQGAEHQYLVHPEDISMPTSSEIAQIISDDNVEDGRVINLSEEDVKQMIPISQKVVEPPPPMTNNIRQRFEVTRQVKNFSAIRQIQPRSNIVSYTTRPILTARRVVQPRPPPILKTPLPKTTIEVLDDVPDDVFDDEEFLKPTNNGATNKSSTSQSKNQTKMNGTPVRKSPTKPVVLNSLTSSTKTYARTRLNQSTTKMQSGTISTISFNNEPSKHLSSVKAKNSAKESFFDSLVLPSASKRKLPTNTYLRAFYCNGCGESFIHLRAFSIHRSWCQEPTKFSSINNLIQNDYVSSDSDVNDKEDKKCAEFEFENEMEDDEQSSIGSENSAQLNGFRENDLVWHNLKAGLWPAFIMKLYIDEEVAEIQLIHSTLKRSCFKVPVDKLLKYDHEVRNMKMKSFERDVKLFQAFHACEQYLKKRALDENVNPYVFFNTSNISAAPTKPQRKVLNIDYRKVMGLIKEGKVEAHLIGIYRETLECERQQNWRNRDEDSKVHVGFGPMQDEDLQDELRNYCTNLFVANFHKESVDDLMLYMMNVWIPEAIVRSISKLYNIDVKEAEVYFA